MHTVLWKITVENHLRRRWETLADQWPEETSSTPKQSVTRVYYPIFFGTDNFLSLFKLFQVESFQAHSNRLLGTYTAQEEST